MINRLCEYLYEHRNYAFVVYCIKDDVMSNAHICIERLRRALICIDESTDIIHSLHSRYKIIDYNLPWKHKSTIAVYYVQCPRKIKENELPSGTVANA